MPKGSCYSEIELSIGRNLKKLKNRKKKERKLFLAFRRRGKYQKGNQFETAILLLADGFEKPDPMVHLITPDIFFQMAKESDLKGAENPT